MSHGIGVVNDIVGHVQLFLYEHGTWVVIPIVFAIFLIMMHFGGGE